MAEPLKITDAMKELRRKKKDKIIESINQKIERAIELGWTDTNFECDDDSLYDEIKREYINAGYKFHVNIFARCGGRNEMISW